MAILLNSLKRGSNLRMLETTGKLQILQQMEVRTVEKGNLNLGVGDLIHMGVPPQTLNRIKEDEKEKEKKKE